MFGRMKNKFLIVPLIAVAMAASFGAAAAISVSANDIGAGSADVVACDPDGVVVGWNTGFNNTGTVGPAYYLDQIKVQEIHPNCIGQTLKLTITTNGTFNTEFSGVIGVLDQPIMRFSFAKGLIADEEVDDVHVEIRQA